MNISDPLYYFATIKINALFWPSNKYKSKDLSVELSQEPIRYKTTQEINEN